jgi:hypothetical protein
MPAAGYRAAPRRGYPARQSCARLYAIGTVGREENDDLACVLRTFVVENRIMSRLQRVSSIQRSFFCDVFPA